MIDMKEWTTECAGLQRGETVRFNHDRCPAGVDIKRRLYLTRPAGSPGIVLAYCHNCQEHGLERSGVAAYRDYGIDPENVMLSTEEIEFEEPTGLEFNPTRWPVEAQVWRFDKHLHIHECENAGIAYDAHTHRIYLPQWDNLPMGAVIPNSTLLGYQLRKLTGKGPKYLTAVANGCTNVGTIISGVGGPTLGYVVEDLASGIAILRGAGQTNLGLEILVNYGTKVNPVLLAQCKNIDLGIVWLDNDNDHVIEQATLMARVWNMVTGKPTLIERAESDPKDVSDLQMHKLQKAHTAWNQST